jgi:geranylgeranyl pyrophosphate synthase
MFENFRDYVETVKPSVDVAFEKQLQSLLDGISSTDDFMLRATLAGGKRIRACLLCMINGTLGGSLDSALPRAVAIELIQTATLIHDDFVDQDTVRRNMPAVWTLEGARRAVLLGDVIFASAIKMMSRLSREDGLVVSDAIAEVARGACHEPFDSKTLIRGMQSGALNGELYERIIHLKTGVLFGAACQLGAIAAQADATLQVKSYEYGLQIGKAYQIADDLMELKQYFSQQSFPPDWLIALVPTLLHFAEDIGPHIEAILKKNSLTSRRPLKNHVEIAIQSMEEEIDLRLKCAISEVERDFPRNDYSELVRSAPWDLIDVFRASQL